MMIFEYTNENNRRNFIDEYKILNKTENKDDELENI